MPALFIENNLGVWQVDELFEELYTRLHRKNLYATAMEAASEKRRLEWVAVRVLLKEMLGHEAKIAYRENGAPYLADSSCHLSVSHTKGFVAVLLDADKRVGVDIERQSDKILPLADKFIHPQREHISEADKTTHLLLHWSGKESVYKLLGETGIIFAEQLTVLPFEPQPEGVFEIAAHTAHTDALFSVRYKVNGLFVLTWTKRPLGIPDFPRMKSL